MARNLLHSFRSPFVISSNFFVPPVFWHQWQLFQMLRLRDVFLLLSVFLLFCSSIFCSSSSFFICLTLLFGMNISSSSFISNKGSSSPDSMSSKSLRNLEKRALFSERTRAKFPALGRLPLLQKTSFGGNLVRNTRVASFSPFLVFCEAI